MSDQSDELEKAYQTFKKQHQVPGKSRGAVVRAAKGRQSTPIHWQSWAQGMVAGLAILGISLFIFLNQQLSQPDAPTTLVNHVQLHGYDPSEADVTDHQQRQAMYYQQYAQQALILTQRYSVAATVLESNGELALTTCQDEVIKLSGPLVTQMLSEQRLSPALSQGDEVDISFNQQGYIVSINRLPAPKQC